MNFKKLLDLFEAPANLNYKGTAGARAIQQTTNQGKPGAVQNVNKIKVGQNLTLPGGGSYQVKPGDTMDKIARRNPTSTAPSVTTAPGPAATAPAPSTDNEALKGQVISQAMAPAPDSRAAVAMASKSAPSTPVAPADSLSPGETIVDTPAPDSRAAVAMASKSAPSTPVQAEPTPAPVQAADSNTLQPSPNRFAEFPQSDLRPGRQEFGFVSEEDEELNELMRLSGRLVSEEELDEDGMPTQTTQPNKTTAPLSKLPTPIELAKDAHKSNQDLTNTQPEKYPDAYKPAPNVQSKSVNSVADFEESMDRELAEMMRLSGLVLNEKAVSKQQQKFMGMVHAIQKGDQVKGASTKLKKVAKTMGKKDAKDFASTKHKGLPTKVSESVMLEAGSTLEHIINKFKHETKNFINGEDLDSDLYEALFDYYMDNGEIPYGVAKARDGDPFTWIADRFENELDMMGHQRTHDELNYHGDHELTELARLAGLTTEDGPGASRLYTRDKSGMGVVPRDTPKDTGMGVVPKDSLKDPGMGVAPKQTSLKDKMSANEGLTDVTDKVIDTAKGVANKGIDWWNEVEQGKKDRWDARAFGGVPGPGHSGYIPATLPRFQRDSEIADRKAHDLLTGANAAAASTPPPDPGLPPGPKRTQPAPDAKRVKEDAELNQMRRIAGLKEAQPPSPGAAQTHAARERERVVSPKIDKFDKEKDAAEKGRRDIVDRESPDANNFGRTVGKAIAKPIKAVKSAWHGATDAWDHEMGNDTYPDPKPPVSVVSKQNWKGDKDNPALKECGDMGIDSQQDSMNISTNMSSDGNKSVTVTAQGEQAAALINMLRLAGMNSDHVVHDHKPEIVMVSSDDEEMMDEAERVTQYANTPDEEYETIDSIIRQGNDLNREKRQYAGKPRLGDNPMAEAFALDLDLDAMLESILIRENDSPAKKVGDAIKNPGDAAKDAGDKVKGRLSFTKDAEGKTSVKSSTGRIKATMDGNKTHYEPGEPSDDKEKTNEGTWDDVSNFVGDVVGTEASKLRQSSQLRDLDALRKQYKGTPYEKQVNDRYDTHLNRLQLDQGDVMDYDPKTGIERLKPVVPPDQWKGGK